MSEISRVGNWFNKEVAPSNEHGFIYGFQAYVYRMALIDLAVSLEIPLETIDEVILRNGFRVANSGDMTKTGALFEVTPQRQMVLLARELDTKDGRLLLGEQNNG